MRAIQQCASWRTQIVEGDLLPVDIHPAYDRHQGPPRAPRPIGRHTPHGAPVLGRSPCLPGPLCQLSQLQAGRSMSSLDQTRTSHPPGSRSPQAVRQATNCLWSRWPSAPVAHRRIRPYWIKAAPLRSAVARRRAGLCLGRPARRTPGQHAQRCPSRPNEYWTLRRLRTQPQLAPVG